MRLTHTIVFVLALLMAAPSTAAQQTALVAPQNIPLYNGPSTTYSHEHLLPLDASYTVEARNTLGNWVRVAHTEQTTLAGWTQTASLRLGDQQIRLSEVPVADIPDATRPNTTALPAILYTTPVLPDTINADYLADIYQRGQEQGNYRHAVVKVGDCNTASDKFLTPIDAEGFNPGPYDFLSDTVALFGESFGRESIAARDGFNVSSIFDPFWANNDLCNPDETPLVCEYRNNPASVAFIMFGQNDVLVLNRDQYRDYLRQTIDETIERGIIPVLSTFTNNPENTDNWDQIIAMNVITIQVAQEYDIPLINFWLAAQDLPSYGIGDDYAHLTAGGASISFTEGREGQFGLTLYNLAVLNMLDTIYHEVIQVYTYESTRSG